ncbi:hypothetical protein [Sphaerisporangium aureirubrum]|uniref:Uncharacterized protein n=1 Tax=Sphaerisporangium aureirubrum TaxID=1544736 RepID=A0ABW1NC69_9ACTN
MSTRLPTESVVEVASWLRGWRGDLPVLIESGPLRIVLQQQYGRELVFEADAIQRLVVRGRKR